MPKPCRWLGKEKLKMERQRRTQARLSETEGRQDAQRRVLRLALSVPRIVQCAQPAPCWRLLLVPGWMCKLDHFNDAFEYATLCSFVFDQMGYWE